MRRRSELDGWQSLQGRGPDGSIESDERVRAARPVVARGDAGARHLGDRYWLEVARASRGAVRRRDTARGIELRVFGRGPCLLRFGPPDARVGPRCVSCSYAILGGLLARRPGGSFTLSQAGDADVELRAAVNGFAPRLAAQPYEQLQRRAHLRISRRYFRALIAEATP